MSKDPYEVLGIQRDAPLEVVKRAFRALSSKAHPDRNGGDSRKQQELNDAYAVLSDPQRRRQYDETGTLDNRMRDSKARDWIIKFVQDSLQQPESFSGDPDPIAYARKQIADNKTSATLARANATGIADRLKRRVKKLKRKDNRPDDFLIGAVTHTLEQATNMVKIIDADLEAMDVALKMLDEWEWTGEAPMQAQGPQFRTLNWSSTL